MMHIIKSALRMAGKALSLGFDSPLAIIMLTISIIVFVLTVALSPLAGWRVR